MRFRIKYVIIILLLIAVLFPIFYFDSFKTEDVVFISIAYLLVVSISLGISYLLGFKEQLQTNSLLKNTRFLNSFVALLGFFFLFELYHFEIRRILFPVRNQYQQYLIITDDNSNQLDIKTIDECSENIFNTVTDLKSEIMVKSILPFKDGKGFDSLFKVEFLYFPNNHSPLHYLKLVIDRQCNENLNIRTERFNKVRAQSLIEEAWKEQKILMDVYNRMKNNLPY